MYMFFFFKLISIKLSRFTEIVAAKVPSQPIIPHCFLVRIRHDEAKLSTSVRCNFWNQENLNRLHALVYLLLMVNCKSRSEWLLKTLISSPFLLISNTQGCLQTQIHKCFEEVLKWYSLVESTCIIEFKRAFEFL